MGKRSGPTGMDLSALKGGGPTPLVGEDAAQARADAEGFAGFRCGGCRRRVIDGFEFTKWEPVFVPGQGKTVRTTRQVACSRDDCDFTEKCLKTFDVMKVVRYLWLDQEGVREKLEAVRKAREAQASEAAAATSG